MSGVSAHATFGAGFRLCLKSRSIHNGQGLPSGREQGHAHLGAPRTLTGANLLNESRREMKGVGGERERERSEKPFDLLT